MAFALAGGGRRASRETGTLLTGLMAVAAFGAALYLIGQRDSRGAFVALGVCAVATGAALALGYRRRPYLAFVVPAFVVYTMFVMFPAVSAFRFSLYNWGGLGEPTNYVGLANYREIFSN